jgi:drug/metabolite transporter (DMT)-like permease
MRRGGGQRRTVLARVTTEQAPWRHRASLGLALGTAVAAISSAALFILLADPVPPVWIAAGRVLVTGLAIGVLAPRSVLRVVRVCRRHPKQATRLLLAAALLAVHFAAWIASLSMTSVLRSVTLVTTQPLFAGLMGYFIGDRAPWKLYAGSVVAVLGTVVMVTADEDLQGGRLLGDALALLGAVAAAGYFVVGRSVRTHMELRGWLVSIHLLAAVLLAGFALAMGISAVVPGIVSFNLVAILVLGLVPGVVGHGLLNWSVRRVPVHVVSLVVLLEPVGAAALAAVFAGRMVVAREAVGAAIVLAGIAVGLLTVSRRARRLPIE